MLNPTEYKYWDLKYYYSIHRKRQEAQGNIPLKYDQFIKRLRVMNLHDAIYTPRRVGNYDRQPKTPIQDSIRRVAKLKEQNVQLLDFDEIEKLENTNLSPTLKQPKPTLKDRFISFLKRWQKRK